MSTKTKTPVETIEEVVSTGQERIHDAFKASTQNATKGFEKAAEFSRKQMDDMNKYAEDLNAFAKGNLEAVMASSQAAAKGFEALSKAATEYSKKSVEGMGDSWKTLSSARTPKDFFEAHNATMKAQYDTMVAETSKFSEMGLKVMTDMFEPLSSRMSVAVEKFSKPIAR